MDAEGLAPSPLIPLYPSNITTLRPIRTAPGEDGRAWAAALSDPAWESNATLLKRDTTTTVHRATLRGREVVIKTWRLSAGAKLKSLLASSRAHRHWRGAAWLAAHGFRTATCYALLRNPGTEVLIMEALPGKSVLHHLADRDLTVRQQHALAAELGRVVARFRARSDWRGHAHNRDHKPSNLIATSLDPPQVAIIDCVAIRHDWFDSDQPFRMLADLLIEPLGVGHPPRRTLMMRALLAYFRELDTAPDRAKALRHFWQEVTDTIRAHGDPTPRVNPL